MFKYNGTQVHQGDRVTIIGLPHIAGVVAEVIDWERVRIKWDDDSFAGYFKITDLHFDEPPVTNRCAVCKREVPLSYPFRCVNGTHIPEVRTVDV